MVSAKGISRLKNRDIGLTVSTKGISRLKNRDIGLTVSTKGISRLKLFRVETLAGVKRFGCFKR